MCFLDGHLGVQGLFRLSGEKSEVALLRDAYNAGVTPAYDTHQRSPHAVANLLKLFLRELPQSLLLVDDATYAQWVQWASQPDRSHAERVAEAQRLLCKLPTPAHIAAAHLCRFLGRVAQHSDANKVRVSFSPFF